MIHDFNDTQLLAHYFDGYFRQVGMYRQMWPDEQWKGYIQDHISKSSVLRRYVRATLLGSPINS